MADCVQNAKLAHCLDFKERTADIAVEANVNFRGLFLSSSVIKGLEDSGFVKPSPIQLEAIPLGRCGLDLIVQAKSGTGKTCVFVVIALEAIASSLTSGRTQVLILAPTREIAVQINDAMIAIGGALPGLQSHFFIGGMPLDEDKLRLKRCHVAVGTPGRIQQLIKENVLKTKSIRLFVIDEADKLLDSNFQETINWIYSQLPPVKQMLALSATYKEEQAALLTRYMRNPTFVRLDALRPVLLGLQQFYCNTGEQHSLPMKQFDNKAAYLLQLFSHVSFKQCLVFTNYQMRAQSLCDKLISKGWPSACIAGNQEQQLRLKTLSQLKKFECRVLITTDLTARGIDVENVDLVINLDVPWDTETYLHRIGRAGRYGSLGIAITLTSSGEEQERLNKIQSEANLNIKELPVVISRTPLKRERLIPSRPRQDSLKSEMMTLPNSPEAAPKVDDLRFGSLLEDFGNGEENSRGEWESFDTYNSLRNDLKSKLDGKSCEDGEPVVISLRNIEVSDTQDQCVNACKEALDSRCRFVGGLQKNLDSLVDSSKYSHQYNSLLAALQDYVTLPSFGACGNSHQTVRSQEGKDSLLPDVNITCKLEDAKMSEENVGFAADVNNEQYIRVQKRDSLTYPSKIHGAYSHSHDWYSHCQMVNKYYGKWWEEYNKPISFNRNPNFYVEYLKAMTQRKNGNDIFS